MAKGTDYKDLNFQLGYFVGEQIVDMFLPTLSIDGIQIRRVIQCAIGEADEYHRLDDIWSKAYRKDQLNSQKEWDEVRAYDVEMQKKYLPETVRCHLMELNPTDMLQFKLGINNSLWNSDCCSYKLTPEDIEVVTENGFTIITLKRGV